MDSEGLEGVNQAGSVTEHGEERPPHGGQQDLTPCGDQSTGDGYQPNENVSELPSAASESQPESAHLNSAPAPSSLDKEPDTDYSLENKKDIVAIDAKRDAAGDGGSRAGGGGPSIQAPSSPKGGSGSGRGIASSGSGANVVGVGKQAEKLADLREFIRGLGGDLEDGWSVQLRTGPSGGGAAAAGTTTMVSYIPPQARCKGDFHAPRLHAIICSDLRHHGHLQRRHF